jgi:CRISPR/Cas system-associated exonuclease Cas4 (RecB family)
MSATAVLEPAPSCSAVPLDHLSWSSIKTYATCPKKFEYKYVTQAPEEFKASSLVFGGAFHKAVESICEARLRGDPVPEIEAVLATFDSAWAQEIAFGPEMTFCKDEDSASLRELAQRMLAVFREYAINEATLPEPAVIVGIEESRRFRVVAEVPPIESRIDLLELHGTDLIVTDLKTSRSRWNDTKVQEAIPQLILYASSLVPMMKELGATRVVPRFVVVSKAKTPVVQVLEPKATQDDVTRLKQTVTETWAAIQTGLFVKRESWACAQCPFRGRCLGR